MTLPGTLPESDCVGTAPAARCRPVPLKYMPRNRTEHPPNATRLLNLKGLTLSSFKTLAAVQKQTGPNTSVYSIVPQTKEKVTPLSANSSLDN